MGGVGGKGSYSGRPVDRLRSAACGERVRGLPQVRQLLHSSPLFHVFLLLSPQVQVPMPSVLSSLPLVVPSLLLLGLLVVRQPMPVLLSVHVLPSPSAPLAEPNTLAYSAA